MIRYTPPKSRMWGHSVNRLSACELLERAELFLREKTVTTDLPEQRSLTIAWTNGVDEELVDAVDLIRSQIHNAPEIIQMQERSFHLYRWQLAAVEMPTVVRWIDRHETRFSSSPGNVIANRHINFRWLDSFRGDESEIPIPQTIGLIFARPRAVSMPLTFYTVAHYQQIKSYLAEIGLVEMSDKHVRPKGILSAAKLSR